MRALMTAMFFLFIALSAALKDYMGLVPVSPLLDSL
jgi:hypothetical protein